MNTIFIVLPILTVLMFDLGLSLNPSDFRRCFVNPRGIAAGLIGQIVFLPVLAFAIGRVMGLDDVFFLGLLLVACSPGGSSSNVFSMLAGGDVALSVSLTALSSIITLFTAPLILGFGDFPVGNLLVQNLVLMGVPIAAGLCLSLWRKSLSEKIHAVLKRLAFPSLIILAGVFFFQHRETILREFSSLGLCVTMLILSAMTLGLLLSRLLRLDARQRRTIAIEVGMQNAAQAIAMACSPFVFDNEIMAIPAIIYALMMNVVLLAYVSFCLRRSA